MERVVVLCCKEQSAIEILTIIHGLSMLNCSSVHSYCVLRAIDQHDAIQLHSDQSGKLLFIIDCRAIVRSLIKSIIPVGRFCRIDSVSVAAITPIPPGLSIYMFN